MCSEIFTAVFMESPISRDTDIKCNTACRLLYAGFLIDLIFKPASGSDMLLWIVGRIF
jgi:hypothetical protein